MFKLKSLGEFIIFCTTISSLECSYLKKDSYPNIEDIISFDRTKEEPVIPKNAVSRNFSIDIEKLDIQKFRRNQDSFKKQILGEDALDDDNITVKFNETRRYIPWFGNAKAHVHAAELHLMTKIADIMLQTIYMARQKIKTLEREEVVKINKETKSYRIAFLFHSLRNYWKKISNVYMTQKDNRDQVSKVMHITSHDRKFSPWLSLNPFIILHHKAAKVHIDFLKTWWVFVKVYERQGGRNTTPRD